ncbi:MAG: copper-translocating P-type ATPase [Candidatus Sericytochromatia bacterium]
MPTHEAPRPPAATHAHAGHPPAGHERAPHGDHHAMMIADFRRRFWVSLVLTIPIVLISPMMGFGQLVRFPGDGWVAFALSSVVYLYGGWPFLTGLLDELKARRPGMMTLVAVAITTAYLYSTAVVFGLPGMGFYWELATLIDIMLLGHWLEMRSVMGASRALEALARLMPQDAHRLEPDGRVVDVPLSELKPGDHVLIKPGEKVPADGVVYEGASSVNEAMLTGESQPVPKSEGDPVIGGAVNGEGSLEVEVRHTGEESFLAQVIALVREAQGSKSRTQDLANRAAMWLTLVALGGGALTFAAWALWMRQDLAFAMERAVTVMVIACPHALGVAVPLVVATSTAIAARQGLLIRNRAAFEQARNIQAIVFDKTGTLTEGRFGVTDVLSFDADWPDAAILRHAAAVEAHSEHPIAQGVVAAATDVPPVGGFRAIPGQGAEGTVAGVLVQVVSPGFVRERGDRLDDPRFEALAAEGKTVVFVRVADRLVGAIGLADLVRPESAPAIARLRAMGIHTIMLTGDHRPVAEWVARQVGVDEVIAEVLPQQKAERIREIQSRGWIVAMTGDGVNDAPALAQADVGIAVGAGTDVAIAAADVILVRSDPRDVADAVGLAKATYRKMVENLWWATGYNVVALPLAAGVLAGWGVLLSPAVGAVLMSASTVIVALNARRLRLPEG